MSNPKYDQIHEKTKSQYKTILLSQTDIRLRPLSVPVNSSTKSMLTCILKNKQT